MKKYQLHELFVVFAEAKNKKRYYLGLLDDSKFHDRAIKLIQGSRSRDEFTIRVYTSSDLTEVDEEGAKTILNCEKGDFKFGCKFYAKGLLVNQEDNFDIQKVTLICDGVYPKTIDAFQKMVDFEDGEKISFIVNSLYLGEIS